MTTNIHRVDTEDVFRQIHTDSSNILFGYPHSSVKRHTSTLAHRCRLDGWCPSHRNDSFLLTPVSHHHVGGNVEVEQSSENEGAEKPQLPQDHLLFVAGAAQHRVIASSSAPLSQLRSSLPSAFIWPIAGSSALRRLIIARSRCMIPRSQPG